jgi:hypothetical protein
MPQGQRPRRWFASVALAIAAGAFFAVGAADAQAPPSSQPPAPAVPPTAAPPAPEPKGPNTGRVSLTVGVDWTTDYYFRGIVQETEDAIIQPYGELSFKLLENLGPLTALTLTGGVWNSLHWGPTGESGMRADPEVWYELDFYGKLLATLFEDFTTGVIYTAYTSPNDSFETYQEVAFSLAYNDSKLLGPFALNPNLLIAFETKGQADAGRHRGVYLQAGIAPSYTLWDKGTYPVTLALPVTLGLSLSEYYEFGRFKDKTFGYLSVGGTVSVPLAFIPADFGKWQVKGGVQWLHLGDNLKAVNSGDRNEVIGTVGIAFTY